MRANLLKFAAAAVLVLAAGTGASAQSANATAFPPGPSAQSGTTNTSNVNVVNAPTVNVGNPVTMNEPAREFFSDKMQMQFSVGNYNSTIDKFTVPAGKQLVMESVSVYCASSDGSDSLVLVEGLDAGNYIRSIIDVVPPSRPWGAGWAVNSASAVMPVHAYIPSGWSVRVYGSRNLTSGFGSCWVTIVGYYTPAP